MVFSTVAAPICIPTNWAQGSSSPHLHQQVTVLTIVTLVQWFWNFFPLIISEVEHLFMYLSGMCKSSLEKWCLFSSAQLKSVFFFFFLILSCMSSLHILAINLLTDTWLANVFYHSTDCLFTSLMVSFAVQKLFSLM